MMMLKTTLLSILAVVNAGGHTGGHGGAPAPPPDGWPACYRGPKCTSDVMAADFPSGHGCYDCSIDQVSACPACAGKSAEDCGSWGLVLTEDVATSCGAETVVDSRGSSSKPVGISVPACYKGPGCADYPSAHGCYDCGIQTEAQCTEGGGQMFSEAIDITQCYQKTAPKKPWPALSPPSPPPNPPSPPPPQRMTDCVPKGGANSCGSFSMCGGGALDKPKDPPNPTLEPCYTHSTTMTLDVELDETGTPIRGPGHYGGVSCVPVGTCDSSNSKGHKYVSAALKYYEGGCAPYYTSAGRGPLNPYEYEGEMILPHGATPPGAGSYRHNTSQFSSTSVKCQWHAADACDRKADGTLKHPDKCDADGNPFFDHSYNCYPTIIEGCKKQGECAIAYIEQVNGHTNAGHNLAYSDTPASEKFPKTYAVAPARPHFEEMLSNEAMDRQLVDAEETSPGICRSIYKRKAITATHYAEVKVTVAGDVADYTASVLDTMAEHLAYKMNVAVGNVKITAAAGSVVLSIVVGYPSASAASSGAETMNTAMADNTKAAEMLSTPAKSVTVEAVATASSGTGSAPRPVQNLEEEGEEGLTVGAIAGIAVGAAVGGILILIGIGIGICCATKKKATDAKAPPA